MEDPSGRSNLMGPTRRKSKNICRDGILLTGIIKHQAREIRKYGGSHVCNFFEDAAELMKEKAKPPPGFLENFFDGR